MDRPSRKAAEKARELLRNCSMQDQKKESEDESQSSPSPSPPPPERRLQLSRNPSEENSGTQAIVPSSTGTQSHAPRATSPRPFQNLSIPQRVLQQALGIDPAHSSRIAIPPPVRPAPSQSRPHQNQSINPQAERVDTGPATNQRLLSVQPTTSQPARPDNPPPYVNVRERNAQRRLAEKQNKPDRSASARRNHRQIESEEEQDEEEDLIMGPLVIDPPKQNRGRPRGPRNRAAPPAAAAAAAPPPPPPSRSQPKPHIRPIPDSVVRNVPYSGRNHYHGGYTMFYSTQTGQSSTLPDQSPLLTLPAQGPLLLEDVPREVRRVPERASGVQQQLPAKPERASGVPQQQSPAVPERASGIPQQLPAVPERASGVQEPLPAVPECASGIPQQSPTVPEHTSGVQEPLPAVPECASGVQQKLPAVPERASGLPQQSPTVPEHASVVSQQLPPMPERASGVLDQSPAVPEREPDRGARADEQDASRPPLSRLGEQAPNLLEQGPRQPEEVAGLPRSETGWPMEILQHIDDEDFTVRDCLRVLNHELLPVRARRNGSRTALMSAALREILNAQRPFHDDWNDMSERANVARIIARYIRNDDQPPIQNQLRFSVNTPADANHTAQLHTRSVVVNRGAPGQGDNRPHIGAQGMRAEGPSQNQQPVRAPLPQPVRAPLPQPVRAPHPEPVRAPLPQPVRAPLPQPVRAPLPQPVRTRHAETVLEEDGPRPRKIARTSEPGDQGNAQNKTVYDAVREILARVPKENGVDSRGQAASQQLGAGQALANTSEAHEVSRQRVATQLPRQVIEAVRGGLRNRGRGRGNIHRTTGGRFASGVQKANRGRTAAGRQRLQISPESLSTNQIASPEPTEPVNARSSLTGWQAALVDGDLGEEGQTPPFGTLNGGESSGASTLPRGVLLQTPTMEMIDTPGPSDRHVLNERERLEISAPRNSTIYFEPEPLNYQERSIPRRGQPQRGKFYAADEEQVEAAVTLVDFYKQLKAKTAPAETTQVTLTPSESDSERARCTNSLETNEAPQPEDGIFELDMDDEDEYIDVVSPYVYVPQPENGPQTSN